MFASFSVGSTALRRSLVEVARDHVTGCDLFFFWRYLSTPGDLSEGLLQKPALEVVSAADGTVPQKGELALSGSKCLTR
jgi:hypothetical protein